MSSLCFRAVHRCECGSSEGKTDFRRVVLRSANESSRGGQYIGVCETSANGVSAFRRALYSTVSARSSKMASIGHPLEMLQMSVRFIRVRERSPFPSTAAATI